MGQWIHPADSHQHTEGQPIHQEFLEEEVECAESNVHLNNTIKYIFHEVYSLIPQ